MSVPPWQAFKSLKIDFVLFAQEVLRGFHTTFYISLAQTWKNHSEIAQQYPYYGRIELYLPIPHHIALMAAFPPEGQVIRVGELITS